MYEIENVSFRYQLGNQTVQALQQVSLSIPKGQFVCLAGPSGSGKSTLLNLLGLIEPVQEGRLRLDGKDLAALSEKEKNRIRRFEVGFVFQHFHLFPVLAADENIEYFLSRQGVGRAERVKRVRAALEAVGIWEQRRKKPLEMSGGQRQRVAIARALVKSPKVIIADEPTASLDQRTGNEIMEILGKLCREQKTTVVAASHDPMVIGFAERVVRMKDGLIESIPQKHPNAP